MKKIKDKVLWCIGYDRLMQQEQRYGVTYYDGFMYSECGHIVLGLSNKENPTPHSPIFSHKSDEMMFGVSYTVGLWK